MFPFGQMLQLSRCPHKQASRLGDLEACAREIYDAESSILSPTDLVVIQTTSISQSCFARRDSEATRVLATFALCRGLYLTGGVTRRLGDWLLDEGSLLGAYFDKGRLSPLLDKVPLMVVKADNLAERGAHLRTVQLLHQEIDNQGRRLFDALDHRRRGKLHMIDLERACAKAFRIAPPDVVAPLRDAPCPPSMLPRLLPLQFFVRLSPPLLLFPLFPLPRLPLLSLAFSLFFQPLPFEIVLSLAFSSLASSF